MVNYKLDAGQTARLIRGVRALSGNRRGPLSRSNAAIISQAIDEIRDRMERFARGILRNNLSDGPPLSTDWSDEKEKAWSGGRWYETYDGGTMKVSRPPFAMGGDHKGVFTGFLDSELTSWIAGGMTLSTPPEIRVGFRATGNVHPIAGMDAISLAFMIHFGWKHANGQYVPPRPFLNTLVSMLGYRNIANKVINNAINSMAASIAGGTP